MLVAALVLVLAAAGRPSACSPRRPATPSGRRRPRSRSTAPRRRSRSCAASYEELALTAHPAPLQRNPLNPNNRVVNGNFAPQARTARRIRADGRQRRQPLRRRPIEGGVVKPGPIPFTDGERQRQALPLHRLAQRHKLPGKRSRRRPAPATGLQADRRRGEARHARQRNRANATTSKSSRSSRSRHRAQRSTRGPNRAVAARHGGEQDERTRRRRKEDRPARAPAKWSPRSSSSSPTRPARRAGRPTREEITGDHLLHNTLGTCASGLQTGTTHRRARRAAARRPARPRPRRRNQPAALRLLQRLLPRADAGHRQGRADPPRRHQRLPLHADRDDQPRVAGPPLGDRPDAAELQDERQGDARVLHPDPQRRPLPRARSASTSSTATKPARRTERHRHAADKHRTGGTAYWTYTPQGNGVLAAKRMDQGAADDGTSAERRTRSRPATGSASRSASTAATPPPTRSRSCTTTRTTRPGSRSTPPRRSKGARRWPPPRRSPSSEG